MATKALPRSRAKAAKAANAANESVNTALAVMGLVILALVIYWAAASQNWFTTTPNEASDIRVETMQPSVADQNNASGSDEGNAGSGAGTGITLQ